MKTAFQGFRIGYGEDAHALEPGRPLVLGGIAIPDSPHGAVAHSDGDALLHALGDALLSAFALGDIGHYFPPTEPRYQAMASREILAHARRLLHERAGDVAIVNVAAVITLDQPKLGPHREAIQAEVAKLLQVPVGCVGLTFKTSEGLAPHHVQVRASLLLHYQ
jgi:2-C-methyl-D-erythritol 2,4-cyclodiphosphate synthase